MRLFKTLDGKVVAVISAIVALLSAGTAQAMTRIDGRHVIDKDWPDNDPVGPAIGTLSDAVVLQTNHTVVIMGGHHRLGQHHLAAYLLEGGTLSISNNCNWHTHGTYTTTRMTGGSFSMVNSFWQKPDDDAYGDMLPRDFVFGGDVNAKVNFSWNGQGTLQCDYNIAVMGNAYVYSDDIQYYGKNKGLPEYKRTISANGGTMIRTMWNNMETNTFYSFNGGRVWTTMSLESDRNGLFGNTHFSAPSTWVRVYENGGAVSSRYPAYDGNTHGSYISPMPPFRKPEGKAVKSIVLTDAAKNKNGEGWDFVPAVVITDDPGCGSNAVAVVDYDYKNRAITNITIVCGGENYSDNAKAELRYSKSGDPLFSLDCVEEECLGGDFTFGGCYSYTVKFDGVTNTYHGATIVDMDPDGLTETATKENNRYKGGSIVIMGSGAVFENSTNLVMKSGLFDVLWTDKTIADVFPACRRLDLYGGYLSANGSNLRYSDMDTVVVGGVAWFDIRRGANLSLGARIAVTNELVVDAACMTNGVTPMIKSTDTPEDPSTRCGRIKFNTGCKVTVKNWGKIPKNGGWQTILDLSEVWVNVGPGGNAPSPLVSGVCVPEIAQPEGSEGLLDLRWDLDENGQPLRLKAKPLPNGLMLIFK